MHNCKEKNLGRRSVPVLQEYFEVRIGYPTRSVLSSFSIIVILIIMVSFQLTLEKPPSASN